MKKSIYPFRLKMRNDIFKRFPYAMTRGSAFIVMFFLNACSTFLQPTPLHPNKPMNHYMPWTQRKAQFNHLPDWQVNGNIAIHAEKGSGVNASFSWQQMKNTYQLRLFGPFGTQGILLNGNPTQVTLLAHNQKYTSSNAEQLLAKEWGVHLPVLQLYYWLRGLPSPQSRYTLSLDAYNRLLKLRQSGWQINYLQYTNSGKLDIPDRIVLYNAQWKVHILITHWEFN